MLTWPLQGKLVREQALEHTHGPLGGPSCESGASAALWNGISRVAAALLHVMTAISGGSGEDPR